MNVWKARAIGGKGIYGKGKGRAVASAKSISEILVTMRPESARNTPSDVAKWRRGRAATDAA